MDIAEFRTTDSESRMYGIPKDNVITLRQEVREWTDRILEHVDTPESEEEGKHVAEALAVVKAASFTAAARMAVVSEVVPEDPNLEDLGLRIEGMQHTAHLTISTFGDSNIRDLVDEATKAILRAGPAPWELAAADRCNATREHRSRYEGIRSWMDASGIPSSVFSRPVRADAEPWIWELGQAACLYAGALELGCSTWSHERRVAMIFYSEYDQSVATIHHEKMKASLDDVVWTVAEAIAELTSAPPLAR